MNVPARNTLVHLLAVYTNPESHNAQTDGRHDDDNSGPRVAVRSANKSTIIVDTNNRSRAAAITGHQTKSKFTL